LSVYFTNCLRFSYESSAPSYERIDDGPASCLSFSRVSTPKSSLHVKIALFVICTYIYYGDFLGKLQVLFSYLVTFMQLANPTFVTQLSV
jgi:hypothetical protein